MIHASKLLSSSSPLGLSKLEGLAHDLVFRKQIKELPTDPKELLLETLDKNAMAHWTTLDSSQQDAVLADFSDALNNAIFDFKYSEYSDDEDEEQHVTSFRSFK